MSTYLIIGAGAMGSAVAEQLADQGHRVRVMTRSASGPRHPSLEMVGADATNVAAVTAQATGTEAIFNCANPAYHKWSTDWPPIAGAILCAAESTGSALVTLNNLYAYGRPAGPMTPHDPLTANYAKAQVRATMWRDAKRAHDEGRIAATEVRASDFIGPNAQGFVNLRAVPRVLAGKGCQVLGSPDVPHSWNYTVDVARTMVTCAQREESWGRAWHAPANPPRTQRELLDDIADVAGVSRVKVTSVPMLALRALGLFSPMVRELPTTMYQFNAPFVIDDSETRATFGLEPTPWSDVLKSTVAAHRDH
jgi:nucleoside-diphosphate-sugar epimerase